MPELSSQAVLSDSEGTPRVLIERVSAEVLSGPAFPARVSVQGPNYSASANVPLSSLEVAQAGLASLLHKPSGVATLTIFGHRHYTIGGPLLVCSFVGDGKGHYTVGIAFAEARLRVKDEFLTDQTCLGLFALALEDLARV